MVKFLSCVRHNLLILFDILIIPSSYDSLLDETFHRKAPVQQKLPNPLFDNFRLKVMKKEKEGRCDFFSIEVLGV